MTYQELDFEYFKTNRRWVRMYSNTWLTKVKDDDGSDMIQLIYHNTAIVTFTQDGCCTVRNGGWYSRTTKDRMNTFLPVHVFSSKGQWAVEHVLHGPGGTATTCSPYANGMVFDKHGKLLREERSYATQDQHRPAPRNHYPRPRRHVDTYQPKHYPRLRLIHSV